MAWAPDYVTLAGFKAYARVDDDADDAQIQAAISMASRAADKQCGRQFGRVAAPEARTYTARFSRARGAVWYAELDDFPDLAGLAVAWDGLADGTFSTTVPTGAVVPWPVNNPLLGKPYERLLFRAAAMPGIALDDRYAGLRVTLQWGWASVPPAVPGAVNMQVNRMHARRDAPFGVAGSPEQGSEVRLLAKLDPDVAVALERFRRRAWAR